MKEIVLLLNLLISVAFNADAQAEEENFVIVEEMPVYPGCEKEPGQEEQQQCTNTSIYKFVMSNVNYSRIPENLKQAVIVYVRFVIDETGEVSKAEVLKGSDDKRINDEAIRVVRSLPTFKPAMQQGKATRVQYTIPIKIEKKITLSSSKKNIADLREPFLKWEDGNLNRYLQTHIDYPQIAKDSCLTGTIYLEFAIGKAGEVIKAHPLFPADKILTI